MTQAPKPRGELGRLLDAAKADSGKQWLEIAIGARLSPSTIQSWINGNTKKPPLFPIAHLATYLDIPPQKLVAAALADYKAANGRATGTSVAERAEGALGEAVAIGAQVRARRVRRAAPRAKRPPAG